MGGDQTPLLTPPPGLVYPHCMVYALSSLIFVPSYILALKMTGQNVGKICLPSTVTKKPYNTFLTPIIYIFG